MILTRIVMNTALSFKRQFCDWIPLPAELKETNHYLSELFMIAQTEAEFSKSLHDLSAVKLLRRAENMHVRCWLCMRVAAHAWKLDLENLIKYDVYSNCVISTLYSHLSLLTLSGAFVHLRHLLQLFVSLFFPRVRQSRENPERFID